jgi:hypothetical protein
MTAMKRFLLALTNLLLAAQVASSQPVTTNGLPAVVERGTYHNYFNCQNAGFATFANFGEDSGADSRLGQFLVGWDTAAFVPTHQPVTRYLIRSCRATVVISDGNQVIYDPTHDALATYFSTNNPALVEDADAGRPVELFGVAFRNGYDTTNFLQCSPVGNGSAGANNVYAICWTTNGTSRDVGNNVGKTNVAGTPFETWPFAVAQTTDAAPGENLNPNNKLTFDLNLADPFLVGYLRRALAKGRLNLMVSSLHQSSGQFGSEPYPVFATRFNEALLDPPTTLELEVTVVRDLDTDTDGLPDDWEQFYFTSLTNTASADFDNDGANNQIEYLADTNPTDAASVFRINTFQHNVTQSELHWPNLPSRRFEMDFSDNLTTWQTITNPALLFPTAANVIWSETTNAPSRYYRVRAVVE